MKNTVNSIFQQYGNEYRKKHPFLSRHEKNVMFAIESCRTEILGARIESCNECGYKQILYNSCRNRHCPQCQSMKKEQWIQDKQNEVFPFQYFHAVFTLPGKLIPLVLRNKSVMYKLLFDAVKETLLSVAGEEKYFGAKIGFFSILHTWGQKLNMHPHLHCVVPGGGYSQKKKRWVHAPQNYLLPIEVLKRRFRSRFLVSLKALYTSGDLQCQTTEYVNPVNFQKLIDALFSAEWVVYIKESFQNSTSVIKYLSRYTHRIAISNYRIQKVENGEVTFSYKDYKEGNAKKSKTVPVLTFMHLFMQHVLPKRFVRIRYYGLISNRNKSKNLEACYQALGLRREKNEEAKTWDMLLEEVTGVNPKKCPVCEHGELFTEMLIPGARGSPGENSIAV